MAILFSCLTLLFHLATSQVPRHPVIPERGSCTRLSLLAPYSSTGLLARSIFPNRVYSESEVQVIVTGTSNTCESPGLARGTFGSVTTSIQFVCNGSACPRDGVYQLSFACAQTKGKYLSRYRPLNGRLTEFQDYNDAPVVQSGCGECSSIPDSESGCRGRLQSLQLHA